MQRVRAGIIILALSTGAVVAACHQETPGELVTRFEQQLALGRFADILARWEQLHRDELAGGAPLADLRIARIHALAEAGCGDSGGTLWALAEYERLAGRSAEVDLHGRLLDLLHKAGAPIEPLFTRAAGAHLADVVEAERMSRLLEHWQPELAREQEEDALLAKLRMGGGCSH